MGAARGGRMSIRDSRITNGWALLFLEYLIAALADGLVSLCGWIGVRLWRKWKRRRKKRE